MKKIFIISFTAILAVFFNSQIVLARSGCCSWHGGVCGCDNYNGRQVCCDGTYSPSCTCAYIPQAPVVVPTLVTFPTSIPIPTSTPYPTFTPIPTSTPTIIPTSTPIPTEKPTTTPKPLAPTNFSKNKVLGAKSSQKNWLLTILLKLLFPGLIK